MRLITASRRGGFLVAVIVLSALVIVALPVAHMGRITWRAPRALARRGGVWPHTHSAYRPYVVALGQLTLAWNVLHEAMSLLFCSVMGGGYANHSSPFGTPLTVIEIKEPFLLLLSKTISTDRRGFAHKELFDKINGFVDRQTNWKS